MRDIVERLRKEATSSSHRPTPEICAEAADEIVRLRKLMAAYKDDVYALLRARH